MPIITLATKAVFGKKQSKDRVTVGQIVNAAGTEKHLPVVIGKVKGKDVSGKIYFA